MELFQLTLKQAIDGLRKKKFSRTELVNSCLKRIKKLNPKLNAFITITQNSKLKTQNYNSNVKTKTLRGIPFGVKDIFVTKGLKTTAGSKVLENYVPEYDATVVKRLKEAGAIIVGKTNCDAWAHGSSGENSDFGPTKNPWNLNYSPGGSSSGSAVAVAGEMSFAAIGTDTGGSVRLPASFCNIVGLKPTYGRVSRYGVIAMASSLDSPGIFSKTVEDCELVFKIISGNDSYDGTSTKKPKTPALAARRPDGQAGRQIKNIKIGIPKEYFGKGLDNEVREVVSKEIERIGEIMEIEEIRKVSLPHTEYGIPAYYMIQTSEVSSNLARYDGIRYGYSREKFTAEAKRRIMLGTYALSSGYYEAYYEKAMRVRTLIKQDFDKAFEKVDVLITPVSPTPPFKLGEKIDDPLTMYLSDILTVPANLAGIPSLALPCGFTKTGLPIGMQIMGPQMSEELLFAIGKKYQELTDWHKHKPDLT